MSSFDSTSDEDLVEMVLANNQNAFEELVNRWEKPILRYTSRLLNFHPQDAEDVTSEVFFKAYKNLASFKRNLKFSSWLYRIAHNTAVNLIRDKSKLFYVDIETFWTVPAKFKDDVKLTHGELEQVLEKLNPTDRNLLILFHLEEKSLREISDILKLTENTVAVKLKRARIRARKFLKI